MKNDSNVTVCPEQFTWLYAGIDFTLAGNGGPECSRYLSVTHRIVETIVILFASIVEVVWSLKRIRYDDSSSLSFRNCQDRFMQNGGITELERHRHKKRYFVHSRIFILPSRESDQIPMTNSLRSCRPLLYHAKMGNPVKCLSQRLN